MKKSLCILLTIVLIALSIPAVGADTAQDKISPELRALLAQHPETGIENGVVVEIFHHNPNYPTEGLPEQEAVQNNLNAQWELIEKIKEITYMEPDGFSIGRFYIGLPYESIIKVAELENLDYIDLQHDEYSSLPAQDKYDDRLRTALEEFSSDTKVNLTLWLAYNEHAYIGLPEPGEDASHAEVDHYLKVMRGKKRDYIAAKNEEFAAVIAENCEVENLTTMRYVPMASLTAKLSEVEKIASLKEVAAVYYDGYIFEPQLPTNNPLTLEEKFEKWMYDTKKLRKYDSEIFEKGLQSWEETYYDYQEIFSGDGWALVYATVNMYDPWEVVDHIRIGDRILSWYAPGAAVYPFGYFVYNAAEDTFYPIDRFVYPVEGYAHTDEGEFIKDENGRYVKEIVEPVISLDDYPGLVEALDELRIGRAVGDADGDGERTVLDATRVQRVKAGLEEADESDLYMIGVGISGTAVQSDDVTWLSWSDADGDGIVTVMDATRIQRAVADLCDIDGVAKD